MRRYSPLITFAGLTAIAAALFGCTTEPITGPTLAATDTAVAGAYNLTSAGGQIPPILVDQTSTQLESVLADQITIVPPSSWVDTTTESIYTITTGTAVNEQVVTGGTYNIADGLINFTSTVGDTSAFSGSVTGTTLTVNFGGSLFYYSR